MPVNYFKQQAPKLQEILNTLSNGLVVREYMHLHNGEHSVRSEITDPDNLMFGKKGVIQVLKNSNTGFYKIRTDMVLKRLDEDNTYTKLTDVYSEIAKLNRSDFLKLKNKPMPTVEQVFPNKAERVASWEFDEVEEPKPMRSVKGEDFEMREEYKPTGEGKAYFTSNLWVGEITATRPKASRFWTVDGGDALHDHLRSQQVSAVDVGRMLMRVAEQNGGL